MEYEFEKRNDIGCSASFNCAFLCVRVERESDAAAQTAAPHDYVRHARLFRSGGSGTRCQGRGKHPSRCQWRRGHCPAAGGAAARRPGPGVCPRAFCGCEASLYVFGKIRPELNLASNWIRKFPRTSPAPGMAAARSGHVMVLMSHVEGNGWLVHDGNSGGG